MSDREAVALLSCPFCGSAAEILIAGCEARRIDCVACDASTVGNTEARAIAAWNRRAPSPEGREGWKPIETCPAGSFVLLYEDGAVRLAFWESGEAKSPDWAVDAYGDLSTHTIRTMIVEPTHWMQLPTPPGGK